jgi:transcriptional regulator with XRE-family HTH domain
VDNLEQQFGDLLRRRREAAELSQEALAHKADLHRTYISLLERGLRMPSLLVIKKLAGALETTMASLMEELERPEPASEQKGASRGVGSQSSPLKSGAKKSKARTTK